MLPDLLFCATTLCVEYSNNFQVRCTPPRGKGPLTMERLEVDLDLVSLQLRVKQCDHVRAPVVQYVSLCCIRLESFHVDNTHVCEHGPKV